MGIMTKYIFLIINHNITSQPSFSVLSVPLEVQLCATAPCPQQLGPADLECEWAGEMFSPLSSSFRTSPFRTRDAMPKPPSPPTPLLPLMDSMPESSIYCRKLFHCACGDYLSAKWTRSISLQVPCRCIDNPVNKDKAMYPACLPRSHKPMTLLIRSDCSTMSWPAFQPSASSTTWLIMNRSARQPKPDSLKIQGSVGCP